MTELIDLDPEPDVRERRWPFYVGWAICGVILGAAMLSHLPAPAAHPAQVLVLPIPAE